MVSVKEQTDRLLELISWLRVCMGYGIIVAHSL